MEVIILSSPSPFFGEGELLEYTNFVVKTARLSEEDSVQFLLRENNELVYQNSTFKKSEGVETAHKYILNELSNFMEQKLVSKKDGKLLLKKLDNAFENRIKQEEENKRKSTENNKKRARNNNSKTTK